MLSTNKIIQSGFVVDSLEVSIARWIRTASIGPFFVMEDVRPDNVLYRSEPASLNMRIAFAQAGPTQIELIQPLGAGPSIYRDSVPFGADGFHHVCYFTEDLDGEGARFSALGAPVACQARFGAMRYAYFDTRHLISCMTEVMEHDAAVEGMFAMIAKAAIDWDGRDPIRWV